MPRLMVFSIAAVVLAVSCTDDTGSGAPPPGEGICVYPAEAGAEPTEQLFDVDTVELGEVPLLRYGEIVWYDTTGHVVQMTISRDSLARRGGVPYAAFVLTVDTERIYGGFFWSSWSSLSCGAPVIMIDGFVDSLQPDQIRITLGYPSEGFFEGQDLRAEPDVIARLVGDGKAR